MKYFKNILVQYRYHRCQLMNTKQGSNPGVSVKTVCKSNENVSLRRIRYVWKTPIVQMKKIKKWWHDGNLEADDLPADTDHTAVESGDDLSLENVVYEDSSGDH